MIGYERIYTQSRIVMTDETAGALALKAWVMLKSKLHSLPLNLRHEIVRTVVHDATNIIDDLTELESRRQPKH